MSKEIKNNLMRTVTIITPVEFAMNEYESDIYLDKATGKDFKYLALISACEAVH